MQTALKKRPVAFGLRQYIKIYFGCTASCSAFQAEEHIKILFCRIPRSTMRHICFVHLYAYSLSQSSGTKDLSPICFTVLKKVEGVLWVSGPLIKRYLECHGTKTILGLFSCTTGQALTLKMSSLRPQS